MEEEIKVLKRLITISKRNPNYTISAIEIQTIENIINELKNSVSKDKIKAKLEELKERFKYYESLNLPEIDDNGIRIGVIQRETIMVLKSKIQILEELLESEKVHE